MALVIANRVQETTTTTGTGTVTLAGAVAGFQSFAVVGNTNTTYYTITSGTAWEVGIGTYSTTGPTLARTTILASSNANAAITLAGTSTVFSSYPAEKVISDGYGLLPVANGGTGQSSYTDGQLLIGNTTGNTLTKTTLTAGTNVTITNGSGAITINAADQFVGTVTSVGQTFTGGLISVAGSPITTSGTLALTVAGTSGGIPYFSSGTTWATSAALAANAIVVGGGAGLAPATVTTGTGVVTALGVNVGTAGSFIVNGGALGTPSSGTVTNLTGTASININGTVGATTPTTGAFTSASLTAGSALAWNADVGLSRSAADTLNLGNGTAGSSSGTLVLTKTNFAGNANITSPSLGNLQVGTGGTTGTGGSLSLTGITASGAISANSLTLTTALSVANGGTGGTTQATARTGLGLGTMSTQDASAVAVTGGTVTNVTLQRYRETVTTGSSSTTYAVDLSTANIFSISMTGNCTFTFTNPPVSGVSFSFMLILKQDATGSRTATWPATVKFPNGSTPTLTTTANKTDIFNFITVDGGTTYFGALSLANM